MPPPHARAVARFFYLWSTMWNAEGRGGRRGAQECAPTCSRRPATSSARRWRDATKGFAQVTLGRARTTTSSRELERGVGELPRARPGWGETLALIALGRVAWLRGPTGRGDSVLRRRARGGRGGRRPVHADRRAPPPRAPAAARAAARRTRRAASADTMRISMALEHDEGIAYALEGLCAVAALRGDVEVAATLAGRRRRSTQAADHDVRRRSSSSTTGAILDAATHARRATRRGAAQAMARGREHVGRSRPPSSRSANVEHGATAPIRALAAPAAWRALGRRAWRNRMRVPGRACASRSSAASVTTAMTG